MSSYKTICKASGNTIEFERIVGEAGDVKNGPTLVFTLGLHGNEPTGLEAFVNVLKELGEGKFDFNGRLVGLAGNTEALEQGKRFIDSDMNRGWKDSELGKQRDKEDEQKSELHKDIVRLKKEADEAEQDFYHFDLHTTSAESIPFSIINQQHVDNIKIAKKVPSSKIINMFPYQNATMTDYWNEKGYTSYLFEGGQHDDRSSIENHESFIWCNLFELGVLNTEQHNELYHFHHNRLGRYTNHDNPFYETCYCHKIQEGEEFQMKPGFTNLHIIKQDEVLASNQEGQILAVKDGNIFMPLYQKQGNDGFFIVCSVDYDSIEGV